MTTTDPRHCTHPGPWPHRARALVPELGEIDLDLCDACHAEISQAALNHLSIEGTDPGLPVFMFAPDGFDRIPADHGSDRYGYVELIGAPDGVEPPADWVDRHLASACGDCNPNLFLHYAGRVGEAFTTAPGVDPARMLSVDDRMWWPVVAHDDGCPTAARVAGSVHKHDPRRGEGGA